MQWRNFKFESYEDYLAPSELTAEELENWRKELKKDIKKLEERLIELKQIDNVFSMSLMVKNTPPKENLQKQVDEMYLPEYRSDGYFNSEEFKEIEKEVDEYVSNIPGVTSQTYELLKQEVLKNKYGINWLPHLKQFMPGVQVIID